MSASPLSKGPIATAATIDTVISRPVLLYRFLPPQSLALHLFGVWDDTLSWSIALLAGKDTLVNKSGQQFPDPDMDSSVALRTLAERKRAFIKFMTTITVDTVKQGDQRREWFKKVSFGCFRESLQPRGYTDKEVNRIHSTFWEYYHEKDILMLSLPEPNQGGPEEAYAYDPTTKKILLFYRP
jgi:hypothetical protein